MGRWVGRWVGGWVGVGGTFGVEVGRKIREKTAHLFLNLYILAFNALHQHETRSIIVDKSVHRVVKRACRHA